MAEPLRHRQTKEADNRYVRPTATAPHLDSTNRVGSGLSAFGGMCEAARGRRLTQVSMGLLHCMSPEMAHRDLASRILVRSREGTLPNSAQSLVDVEMPQIRRGLALLDRHQVPVGTEHIVLLAD